MARSLVIVESPAKAHTISRFLGDDYIVEASLGHVRDLPESATEIPAKYKGQPWARLGVDVKNDFQPIYVVPLSKREHVRKLKALCDKADQLYLATDEDREGESISWHLLEILQPKVPVRRLVFHEITADAIQHALAHAREVDLNLVRAQETRRVLDRLFGYEVSPLLWRKVRPRLSAGRVQSVAVRLLVEREMARMAFHKSTYWSLKASFELPSGLLNTELVAVQGRPVADKSAFDPATGSLKTRSKAVHLLEEQARKLASSLPDRQGQVTEVEERPWQEKPAPPFITSTLQQEANRKFRWSARKTMQVAQQLYENGWITYMRTDSTSLSQEALNAARECITALYGPEYLPPRPRTYRSTSKNAQEAHEAIRPSGKTFRSPSEATRELDVDSWRLYELIWKRSVACQMPDAQGTRVRVAVEVDSLRFQASGRSIRFPGFRKVYVESFEESSEHETEESESNLPNVQMGQAARVLSVEPGGHETQPPPRLTEASLVKELDTRGIGRPSTYASIIDTILARKYVFKKGPALVPTFTAFAVTKLLVATLTDLVDYAFTARMEDELDQVALGALDQVRYLRSFYDAPKGLLERLNAASEALDARDVRTIPVGLPGTEDDIVVRIGRYGPFLSQGDLRVDLPEDLPPDELDLEHARALLASESRWPQTLGLDPVGGLPVLVMKGPYGFYVQLGECPQPPPVPSEEEPPESKRKGSRAKKSSRKAPSKAAAPRRAGLLKGMKAEDLDLETALSLLSLPRNLGLHPSTGDEIILSNGRFGPYLRCGGLTRSLPDPLRVLTMDQPEALSLLDAPRGKGGAAGSLAELGKHPETGAAIRLMNGRFGPYITDGKLNASVPSKVDPASMDLPAALELLKKKAARPPRASTGTRSRKPTGARE